METNMSDSLLQRLVDESDLRNLVLGMPKHLDARDWEAYGRLFTEDAVFSIGGQIRVGRQEIADGPSGDIAKYYQGTQHIMGNIYVDVDGDEADVKAYVIAVHIPEFQDTWTHSDVGGGYDVKARRTEDGWRIAECNVFMRWTSGAPFVLPTEG